MDIQFFTGQENFIETSLYNNKLDFLGYAPCAFKHSFKESIDKKIRIYKDKYGISIKSQVPAGCGGKDEYEDLWRSGTIDEFPDIIASYGLGDFFRKGFIDRFMKKNYFQSNQIKSINKAFNESVFRDPDNWYTVYAVCPYVMLIDKNKLGNLPVPKYWEDLLDPRYCDNIIMQGLVNHISDVPLIYFYKDFGEGGLLKLASNIKATWHPAQMIKAAGTSNSEGAAIYIMSWFFANTSPKTESVTTVWPKDGALTSPLYILEKSDRSNDATYISEFLTGAEFGNQLKKFYYPSLNPDIDNNLPPEASFKWLGWDYIKTHDPAAVREYSEDFFRSIWKK